MSKAEDILFFDVFFTILLFTYGVGVGTVNLNQFSSLPSPQLAPQPGGSNCTWYDFICQAVNANGIARATAYIGWAIVNIPVVLGYILTLGALFGNAILSVTFSATFTGQGVPYLGFVWLGLQLYVIWEVFRLVRGTSVGV